MDVRPDRKSTDQYVCTYCTVLYSTVQKHGISQGDILGSHYYGPLRLLSLTALWDLNLLRLGEEPFWGRHPPSQLTLNHWCQLTTGTRFGLHISLPSHRHLSHHPRPWSRSLLLLLLLLLLLFSQRAPHPISLPGHPGQLSRVHAGDCLPSASASASI